MNNKHPYQQPQLRQTSTLTQHIICLSADERPADPVQPWEARLRQDTPDADAWENGLW